MASAIIWADECQKVSRPSLLSQVCNLTDASVFIDRDKSQTSPFTVMERTSFARLFESDLAISMPFTGPSNSLTLLSGSVICIIFPLFLKRFAKIVIHST
jgi:hypothetical protein